MSSFWGVEVKPEKPYTHTHSPDLGRLRLTQVTLGAEVGKVEKGKRNVVQLQCTVKGKEPVLLCAIVPGQSETCHLDLEFEEKHVTFAVLGPMTVHLAGYYVGVYEEDMCDSDTCSDSLQGSDDDGFMALSHVAEFFEEVNGLELEPEILPEFSSRLSLSGGKAKRAEDAFGEVELDKYPFLENKPVEFQLRDEASSLEPGMY